MNNILARPESRLAKAQLVQMLDAICQAIEPTETQYNDAAERYKTIGEFLAEENSPLHCFQPFGVSARFHANSAPPFARLMAKYLTWMFAVSSRKFRTAIL